MLAGVISVLAGAAAWAGPVTASTFEQQIIANYIKDGLAAHARYDRAKRMEDSLRARIRGGQSQELDLLAQWETAYKVREAAERRMSQSFNEAIRVTLLFYQVRPEGLGAGDFGAARQGPRFGNPIQWSPRFVAGDETYHEYIGADGQKHYTGRKFSPDDGGVTLADGSTEIPVAIFKTADLEKNPGVLAFLLDHEAFHFNEMISRQEDSLQQGEHRAYRRSIDNAKIFKLDPPGHENDPGSWTRSFRRIQADQLLSLRSGGGGLLSRRSWKSKRWNSTMRVRRVSSNRVDS